jgi:ferredoxin, 2Fe-2S
MLPVTFISSAGERVAVTVPHGHNLMRAAQDHGIEGMVGDCGGCLSCATCHVYVEEAFLPRLPAASANEDEMLNYAAAERRPNSRLSCQITMSEEIAGITVAIASPQI